MLLDRSVLHAPFHHLRLVGFGLVEKDVPCAIMTMAVEVDCGSLWESSGLLLLIIYHIASINQNLPLPGVLLN